MPINMTKTNSFHDIKAYLEANELEQAQRLIDEERQRLLTPSATLYYLQGKLFMKKSDWGNAISYFLKAEEVDPDGPARQCRLMLNDIMAFYNKDMFNQ